MVKNIIKLVLGLVLFSIGIIMTLKAQIGYAPWDTFHYGLSANIGLSYGVTAIIVGGVTVLIAVFLGEKIGIGTLLNMTVIGFLCDFILENNFIHTPNILIFKVIMLLCGLLVMAFASFFYISAGLGAGPRDSLMVGLAKKTKLPVGVCRNMIELTVMVIGWLLGGTVGLGTLLSAICMGIFIQWVFKLMKFDVKKVEHLTFAKMREKATSVPSAVSTSPVEL